MNDSPKPLEFNSANTQELAKDLQNVAQLQVAQKPILPRLAEGEEFVCDGGCGTTTPEQYDFEYSREEFADGRVISMTEKAWRSRCCRADVLIYSTLAETFTPIEEYATARPAGPEATCAASAPTPRHEVRNDG